MIIKQPPYKKLALVCTNERTDGRECCAMRGSVEFYAKLKEVIREVDSGIRVIKTSCLNQCAEGISVVLMPENIWLTNVSLEDIPVITRQLTQ